MKPFTKIVLLADDTCSAVTLTDSQSTALACNWVECIPLDLSTSGGHWVITASSLQTAGDSEHSKIGQASGTVGITIPIAASGCIGGPAVLDLQEIFVNEIGVQLYGAGYPKRIALNYGVKIPPGQGWKYRLTTTGSQEKQL